MLESVLADVLTRVLGQYLKGIDRDSVHFGAWSGLIELRGVALRPEALAILFETLGMALPVTVEAGFIGLLRLVVPWKTIGTTPVQIHMQDVTIVARPVRGDGSDDSQLQVRQRRIKSAKLNTDDAVREASWDVASDRYSSTTSTWGTWLVSEDLRATILANIQIHLSDIIIRFEDPYSDPRAPYVASIHCDSLKVVSANNEWNEAFVERNTDKNTRKLLQVKGFRIDWAPILSNASNAPSTPSFSVSESSSPHMSTHELLREFVSASAAERSDRTDPAAPRCLLHPVDGSVRLRLSSVQQLVSVPDFRQQDPSVDLDICFPDLILDLNDVQYSGLLQTSVYFARITTRGFRPSTPKARWSWAVDQLFPGSTKRHLRAVRFTPKGLVETRRRRDLYFAYRTSMLKARRTGVEEPKEIAVELERLEDEMDFDEILSYRNALDKEIEKNPDQFRPVNTAPTANPSSTSGTTMSSFWSMLGYTDSTADSNESSNKTEKDADNPGGKPSSNTQQSHSRSEPRALVTLALRAAFLLQNAKVRLFQGGYPSLPVPRVSLVLTDLCIGTKYSSARDLVVEALLGSIEAWDTRSNTRMVYSKIATRESTSADMLPGLQGGTYPRNVSEAIEGIRSGSNPAKELLLDAYTDGSSSRSSQDAFLDDVSDSLDENETTSGEGGERHRRREREPSSRQPSTSPSTYRVTDGEFFGNLSYSDIRRYIAAFQYVQESTDNTDSTAQPKTTLDVSVATLEAVVDGPGGSFLWGLKFWRPKGKAEDPIMSFLGAAAGARIAQLRMELESALLANSVPPQVNAVILAPRFIVPGEKPSDPSIVVNMGTLGICTSDSSSVAHTDASTPDVRNLRYSNYVLTLDDLGVYFAPTFSMSVSRSLHDGSSGEALGSSDTPSLDGVHHRVAEVERVIRPFSLQFVLQTLRDASVVQVAQGGSGDTGNAEESIAKVRVRGNIPDLSVILTQRAFQHLLALVYQWGMELAARPTQATNLHRSLTAQSESDVFDLEGRNDTSTAVSPTVSDHYQAQEQSKPEDPPLTLASYSIKVAVESVSLELRQSIDAKLVTAVASQLTTNIVKRGKSSVRADLSLRSWSVTDGSRGSTAAFRSLLYAGTFSGVDGVSPPRSLRSDIAESRYPTEQNFVTVHYHLDFSTMEQRVNLRFLSLNLVCVRETYLKLITFFDSVQKHVKYRRQPRTDAMGDDTAIPTGQWNSAASRVGRTSDRASSLPRRTYLASIFDGFRFQLIASGGVVSVFEMRDSRIDFCRKEDGSRLASGTFGLFSVQDLTAPMPEHVDVLRYEHQNRDRDLSDGVFPSSSEQEAKEWILRFPSKESPRFKLTATFKVIRVVLLYRFLEVLQQYVSALLTRAQTAVSSLGEGISETGLGSTSARASRKAELSSRVDVELNLEDLSIRLPRHSGCATESLSLHVSVFHLQSNPQQSARGWNASFDGLNCSVQYLLSELSHDEPTSVSSTFLMDCEAKLELSRREERLLKENQHILDVSHVGELRFPDPICLKLSEAQYTVLYFVLTENLLEQVADVEVSAMHDEPQLSHDSEVQSNIPEGREVSRPTDDLEGTHSTISAKARSTTQMQVRTSTGLEISLPELTLEVSRGWDVTCPACKILRINLIGAKLWARSRRPSRLEFKFGGHLSSVADLRTEGEPAARKVIVPITSAEASSTGSDEGGNNLSVQYERGVADRPSIAIFLHKLQIEVVPELFRDLTYLAIPGWPFLPTSPLAPDVVYAGRTLSVVLGESQVILLSESVADRRALGLTGEFQVKVDWMKVTGARMCALRSSQLEVSTLQHAPALQEREVPGHPAFTESVACGLERTQTPLVYPTDSFVEYIGPGFDEGGRRINVSIEAALCMLCTSEIPVLRAILTRLRSLKASYLSQREWSQPAVVNPTEDNVDENSKEGQRQKAQESLNMSISVPAARYLITDDSNRKFVPLLEVKLSSFCIRAHGSSMVQVESQLSMDLFNQQKGCWEPALETWPVAASMSRGSSGSSAFVVRSEKRLNLNVAPSSVTAAKSVARALRHAARSKPSKATSQESLSESNRQEIKDGSATRPSVAAFQVCNFLGVPVLVCPSNNSARTTLVHTSRAEIGAQSEALVSSSSDNKFRAREKALRCSISISSYNSQELSAAEAGKQSVTFVPQRGMHSSHDQLDALQDMDPIEALWEVEYKNGVPLCTLRSPFRLLNDTKSFIEVVIVPQTQELLDKFPENSEDIAIVDPGASFPIPVNDLKGKVHIRPVFPSSRDEDSKERHAVSRPFFWSSALPTISRLSTLALQSIRNSADDSSSVSRRSRLPMISCKPLGGELEFFFKVLPRTSPAAQRSELSANWLDMSICAPVILQNKLPGLLSYRVHQIPASLPRDFSSVEDGGALIMATGSIDAKDEAHLHFSGNALETSFISLAFENGDRTRATKEAKELNPLPSAFGPSVLLSDLEVGRAKCLIPSPPEVTGADGQKRKTFRASVHAVQNGVSCFTVFGKYWVRNRSDTAVQVCSRTSFYGPGSQHVLLRARPPSEIPDEYICIEGPYLSFRLSHRYSSRDESGSFSWWTSPSTLDDIEKPFQIALPGCSLELEVRPSIGLGVNTHIVTIRNAAWVINCTSSILQWCQQDSLDAHGNCPTRLVRSLRPGDAQGLHWVSKTSEKAVHLRLADETGQSDWIWSPAIPLHIGFSRELPAKMYRPKTHDQYIARVASKEIAGDSHAIIVHEEDRQNPPYRIVNLSRSRAIAFSQVGSTERPWLVRNGKSTRYSWDDPLAPPHQRKLSVRILEKEDFQASSSSGSGASALQKSRASRYPPSVLNIDKVGDRVMVLSDPFVPPVVFNVTVDGATKIVSLYDEGDESSVQQRGSPQQNKTAPSKTATVPVLEWADFGSGAGSLSNSTEVPDRRTVDYPRAVGSVKRRRPTSRSKDGIDAAIFMESIGISCIDSDPEEVVYLCCSGLLLNYEFYGTERSVALHIEDFQIDNQLTKTPYPVLLWVPNKSPVVREGAIDPNTAARKALSVEIHQDLSSEDIVMVKSFQVWVHPVSISFDEGLVSKVLKFLDDATLVGEARNAERLRDIDMEGRVFRDLLPSSSSRSRRDEGGSSSGRVYVHDFRVSSTGIRLTSAGSGAAIAKAAGLGSSARAIVGLLLNVENCDFEFPPLSLPNVFDSLHHFAILIRTYYLSHLDNQRIKLLASNSLMGNPAALFDAVGTGARDFLSEPGRARNSADFLVSVGRGSKSLFTHTVGGLVESVSSIPRAVSSGLEKAVGDNTYLAERERIRGSHLSGGHRGSSAKNPAHGLATGAISFVHGLSSGVTGLIREPVQGARQGGAGGLLKGIGKAVIGGVAKPVAGAIDLVAEPAAGLSRSMAEAEGISGTNSVSPVRAPRAFRGASKRIESYDPWYAVGVWLYKAVGMSSGVQVSSELLDWVELSDRADRDHADADLWVWSVAQRYSRRMPGAKPSKPSSSRPPRGPNSGSTIDVRPEKTRVALLTEESLIIATLDCKLITIVPLWREARFDIVGDGKELVIRSVIVGSGNVSSEGPSSLFQGAQALLVAPWDVSTPSIRRRPAIGESTIERIACGSAAARDDLRKRLTYITTRLEKSITAQGHLVRNDNRSSGQELDSVSQWRGENEQELRLQRELRDWDGGFSYRAGSDFSGLPKGPRSSQYKASEAGVGEVSRTQYESGRTSATLEKTVRRLVSNGPRGRTNSKRTLRIIIASRLSGDLELRLKRGTLERGSWNTEAPLAIGGLDANVLGVDRELSTDGKQTVSGSIIYSVIHLGSSQTVGEIEFEFFTGKDSASSFTAKATKGFHAEFERRSGSDGTTVFSVRQTEGIVIQGSSSSERPKDDQAEVAEQHSTVGVKAPAGSRSKAEVYNEEQLVQQLVDIGFKLEDAVVALCEARGDLVTAVDLLTRQQ